MNTKTPTEGPQQVSADDQVRAAAPQERPEDEPQVAPPAPRWKTITDPPRV